MKIVKSVFNLLGNAIVLLLTVAAIFSVISLFICKQTGQTYNIFGFKPVVIMTGSMEPTVKTNSIVIVKRTDDIKEDDMILFDEGHGNFVLHRYNRTDEKTGKIITKGDANSTEDFSLLDQDKVFGKAVVVMNFVAPIVHMITGNNGL